LTSSCERIIEVSRSSAHFLEFDPPGRRHIGENAGHFLGGALKHHGTAIAIATPPNAAGILARLASMGCEPEARVQDGSLIVEDSAQMLARFATRGVIDADRFDRTVGRAMRAAVERAGGAPVRAFGDMVGILWQREERTAAMQLERLWRDLQCELGFALFCSYPIDVFSEEFVSEDVRGIFDVHTHAFPSAEPAEFGRVLDRAMDEVLGARAKDVRLRIECLHRARSSAAMPKTEQMILAIRKHLPDYAEAILARARDLYDSSAPRVFLRQEHSRRLKVLSID